LPEFDPLRENTNADAVIVGGGITGITAAYLLAKEGLKVVLLEADKLLNGTTGHTTAKITAQHSLIYDELINHMGKSKARLYYEANMDALDFIKKTINEENINCDFSEQDAYIYATTDKSARKLEKEHAAYEKLNINGELTDSIPFDIEVRKVLSMKNQAQFHPIKYLAHLLSGITDNGGRIFERTTAVDVDVENTVVTRDGYRVKGDTVLACSHYPFYDGMGVYYTRMYASRSYIVAVKTNRDYPGGMYISADKPTRSLRGVPTNGEEKLVLLVGESHKTGQGKDTLRHYKALESFGQEVFGQIETVYRWSAQDLVTLDKVPYVGEITSARPDVLVATGYRKWGMSSGTAAAQLLADIVLDKDNPYKKLFDPSRFYADPSLKTFLKQNVNVAGHLIKGKFEMPGKDPKDLSVDEGGVVVYRGGRAGAYKDDEGHVHLVDTTCTHLGCEVEWNHGDRTWDCPCHGSRFSYTGEVVEGPAETSLKKLTYKG
jgi:glycine/D-amino acid oxidase-like deaminating enzyme/nitrite reductase/ring-hydroxylating ferredoxin subunit